MSIFYEGFPCSLSKEIIWYAVRNHNEDWNVGNSRAQELKPLIAVFKEEVTLELDI